MPKLMTVCPATREVIATQLTLDPLTFRTIRLPEFSLNCPSCGGAHVWSGDTAFLDGEPQRASLLDGA